MFLETAGLAESLAQVGRRSAAAKAGKRASSSAPSGTVLGPLGEERAGRTRRPDRRKMRWLRDARRSGQTWRSTRSQGAFGVPNAPGRRNYSSDGSYWVSCGWRTRRAVSASWRLRADLRNDLQQSAGSSTAPRGRGHHVGLRPGRRRDGDEVVLRARLRRGRRGGPPRRPPSAGSGSRSPSGCAARRARPASRRPSRRPARRGRRRCARTARDGLAVVVHRLGEDEADREAVRDVELPPIAWAIECSEPQSEMFMARPPIRLAQAICERAPRSEPSRTTAGSAQPRGGSPRARSRCRSACAP